MLLSIAVTPQFQCKHVALSHPAHPDALAIKEVVDKLEAGSHISTATTIYKLQRRRKNVTQ